MTFIFLELAGAAGYLFLVHLFLKSRGGTLVGFLRAALRRSIPEPVAISAIPPLDLAQCRAQPIGSRKDFAECLMGPFYPCIFAFGVGEVRFCCHPESKKIIAQTQRAPESKLQPVGNGKSPSAPALMSRAPALVTEAAK